MGECAGGMGRIGDMISCRDIGELSIAVGDVASGVVCSFAGAVFDDKRAKRSRVVVQYFVTSRDVAASVCGLLVGGGFGAKCGSFCSVRWWLSGVGGAKRTP